MTILLQILAIAFTAFCVWLTVRFANRRERWVKWTLAMVLLASPIVYLASFGAACWWASGHFDADGLHTVPAALVYWPLGRAKMHTNKSISWAICWVASLYGEPLGIPVTPDGEIFTPCSCR